MPCMELFEAQALDYRDSVIPRQVPARLAVEAGVSQSWWKWVGDRGEVIGDRSLRRLGAGRDRAGEAGLHRRFDRCARPRAAEGIG